MDAGYWAFNNAYGEKKLHGWLFVPSGCWNWGMCITWHLECRDWDMTGTEEWDKKYYWVASLWKWNTWERIGKWIVTRMGTFPQNDLVWVLANIWCLHNPVVLPNDMPKKVTLRV